MRMLGLAVVMMALMGGCGENKVSDVDVVLLREQEVVDALNDKDTVLVDVRKPEAYAAGHLPNAINIFVPDIREGDPRLAEAKRIIVYAAGVRDTLGIAAAKKLVALGYVNVQEFKGGVEQWKSSGRQLVGALPEAEARPETTN